MSPLELGATNRGFAIGHFRDQYGKRCSLQKSSLATEDCIWLGIDEALPADSRMHLTREMVADLLPPLTRFAETGELETVVSQEPDLTAQLATQDARHTLPTDPTPEELRFSRQVLRTVLLPRWWQLGQEARPLYVSDGDDKPLYVSDGDDKGTETEGRQVRWYSIYAATRYGEIVDLTFHVARVLRLPLAYQSYLATDQGLDELEQLLSIALRAKITLRWLP